jgi:hypothetical protein
VRTLAILALARLEAAIGLVDHIGAATTTDHAVIAMTVLQGLERVADLHGLTRLLSKLVGEKTRRSPMGKRKRSQVALPHFVIPAEAGISGGRKTR